ncbi:MAG: hypothetical protein KGI71_03685, partial [Patescibacteria group bacterium]|nr:hypothetical protein [Patescibacteria group bacterium]
MPRTQVPDESREESLDGAHCSEREVRDIVSDAACYAPRFSAQERTKINVRKNEFDLSDASVETRTGGFEKPHRTAALVLRKHKEPYEECECRENEDEVRHKNN